MNKGECFVNEGAKRKHDDDEKENMMSETDDEAVLLCSPALRHIYHGGMNASAP